MMRNISLASFAAIIGLAGCTVLPERDKSPVSAPKLEVAEVVTVDPEKVTADNARAKAQALQLELERELIESSVEVKAADER